MREDMFKVIVERPRAGRSRATKSKLRFDKCEGRSRVTGHRLVTEHSGATKHLNENLAPLKRYLHKQVGRRWDDVFSEICQHLDTGSTVKMHVREHLEDFVAIKVTTDSNGILMTHDYWGGLKKVVDSRTELYVDPEDGRIKQTRKLCKKHGVLFIRNRQKGYGYTNGFWGPPSKPSPIKQISNQSWHVRLKGIWYRVDLSSVPLGPHGYKLSDNALFADLRQNSWRQHDRWRVSGKHQLSGKSLKDLGLINRPGEDMEAFYG